MIVPTIKVIIPNTIRILRPSGPEEYDAGIKSAVEAIAPIAAKAARGVTPVGYKGFLRDSVTSSIDTRGVTIEWTAGYARAVEDGTRPHWVPIRALYPWVATVLHGTIETAYAIQRAIATRGTRPRLYLGRARSAIIQVIGPDFRSRLQTLAKRLQG